MDTQDITDLLPLIWNLKLRHLISLAVSVAAIFVNVLTIIVLGRFCGKLSPHLKLVLNQCVLDCLFVIFHTSHDVMEYVYYHEISAGLLPATYNRMNCLKMVISVVRFVFINGICCNLIAISVELFIGVYKPLHYRAIITARRIHVGIGLVYVSSLVLASIVVAVAKVLSQKKGTLKCNAIRDVLYDDGKDSYMWYLNGTLGILPCMCFIILVTVYGYVLYAARKSSHFNDHDNIRRSAVTSFVVTVTFLFGISVPIILYIMFQLESYRTSHVFASFHLYVRVLLPLNSLIDPLIYAVRLTSVRNGYRKMCGCLGNVRNQPQDRGHINPAMT